MIDIEDVLYNAHTKAHADVGSTAFKEICEFVQLKLVTNQMANDYAEYRINHYVTKHATSNKEHLSLEDFILRKKQ